MTRTRKSEHVMLQAAIGGSPSYLAKSTSAKNTTTVADDTDDPRLLSIPHTPPAMPMVMAPSISSHLTGHLYPQHLRRKRDSWDEQTALLRTRCASTSTHNTAEIPSRVPCSLSLMPPILVQLLTQRPRSSHQTAGGNTAAILVEHRPYLLFGNF